MNTKTILLLIIFIIIIMKYDINIIFAVLITYMIICCKNVYNGGTQGMNRNSVKSGMNGNTVKSGTNRNTIKSGLETKIYDLPDYSQIDKTEQYIEEILGVSADDRLYKQQMDSSQKHKNSLDINANKTSDQSKRYYTTEFEQEENRDWWIDDEYELSKKFKIE